MARFAQSHCSSLHSWISPDWISNQKSKLNPLPFLAHTLYCALHHAQCHASYPKAHWLTHSTLNCQVPMQQTPDRPCLWMHTFIFSVPTSQIFNFLSFTASATTFICVLICFVHTNAPPFVTKVINNVLSWCTISSGITTFNMKLNNSWNNLTNPMLSNNATNYASVGLLPHFYF